MMTHFLSDILRQPAGLRQALTQICGEGADDLKRAATAIRESRHVFLTGIGASWHAALNAGALFNLNDGGRPVYLQDASELLHFGNIPSDSVVIVLSRSGRSIEIVKLLTKAHASGATVIGITNARGEPLARESNIAIGVPVERDHGISANTYSTLGLAAGLLAAATTGTIGAELTEALSGALAETERATETWKDQIERSSWPKDHAPYYFLARGTSLGSCFEARLLWEEGVKLPASAMSTGNFRHGPQEIVTEGLRVGLWIDGAQMREEDLALARDLGKLGASVVLIGQRLPADAADLVIQIPEIPASWQFLIDIIPAQLAAENLSRRAGVDCDSFRVCSYVVEGEHGLLSPGQALPKPRP